MHYQKLEAFLYNYNVTKSNILNLKVEIDELSLPPGIPGVSYEERISSGKISNIPEEVSIKKIEEEERLEARIALLENRMQQLNNALDCLNPIERRIIELKYIDGLQWWQVAADVAFSERRCRDIRKRAIIKMLSTYKS